MCFQCSELAVWSWPGRRRPSGKISGESRRRSLPAPTGIGPLERAPTPCARDRGSCGGFWLHDSAILRAISAAPRAMTEDLAPSHGAPEGHPPAAPGRKPWRSRCANGAPRRQGPCCHSASTITRHLPERLAAVRGQDRPMRRGRQSARDHHGQAAVCFCRVRRHRFPVPRRRSFAEPRSTRVHPLTVRAVSPRTGPTGFQPAFGRRITDRHRSTPLSWREDEQVLART